MVELRRKIDVLLANKPNKNTEEYRKFKQLISRGYPDDVTKLVKIAALLQIALRTPNAPKEIKQTEPKKKRNKKAKGKVVKKKAAPKPKNSPKKLLNEMNYREFLNSDHWRKTKDRAKKMGKYNKCSCCGARDKKLQLHHTTYKYKGTKYELYECRGLVAVCRECHTEIHQVEAETAMSIANATNFVRNKKK